MKVENSRVEEYDVEKTNITWLRCTNPKRFRNDFDFFKQVMVGQKNFNVDFDFMFLGQDKVLSIFKFYFINIVV